MFFLLQHDFFCRTFVLGPDKSAVVPLHQRKATESYQHRARQVAFRSSFEIGARRQTQGKSI